MADLTIRHTHEDGTQLLGSAKGDGVWELLCSHGWQFRAWAGIHLRGTRDTFADYQRIEQAQSALAAAGHTVALDIDDTWRPAAVRWAEREERVDARVDRLEQRATAAARRSVAARDASRKISDGIPAGQPKLTDHHSYAAHDRAEKRMHALDRRSYDEADYADHLSGRARGAAANESARHDPRAMTRRVRDLEAEVRAHNRTDRCGWAPHLAAQARARNARNQEEILFLEALLAAHAGAGSYVPWTREHFKIGDQVRVNRTWLPVRRVNKLSVSVPGGFGMAGADASWNDTVTWDKVTGRRRGGMQWDTPTGEPWPVAEAQRVARWDDLLGKTDDRHMQAARRLSLGLPAAAAEAELRAFAAVGEADRRALALLRLAIYERLAAGEPLIEVAATVEPFPLEAAWTMPEGPTIDVRADRLLPGDIILGHYDRGGTSGPVVRGRYTGLVASVGPVVDRREAGTWVQVTLDEDEPMDLRTHVWFAVYRGGGRKG